MLKLRVMAAAALIVGSVALGAFQVVAGGAGPPPPPAQTGQPPLALRSVMAVLAVRMEAIVYAVSVGDLKAVEKSALEIADHERPPLEERRKIMAFLGDDAEGFKAADLRVHDAAAAVAAAARAEDLDAVAGKFSLLLKGCVACHARFKSGIVGRFYPRPLLPSPPVGRGERGHHGNDG